MTKNSLLLFVVLVFTSLIVNHFFLRKVRLQSDEFDIDDTNRLHGAEMRIANRTLAPNLITSENEASASPWSEPKNDTPSNQARHGLCEATAAWATQPRFRNANPGNVYVGSVVTMNGLSIADDLLGQTFCHEKGRFRTTFSDQWNTSDLALLRDWEFKLIYLSIHDFHHRPAREEYLQRAHCTQILPTNDFQCRRSSFLVANIPNHGAGAALRSGAVAHVLSAIATDRVPVFVANTGVGPDFLQDPWHLASCDRKDLQCVFLPTTPCTLLKADLRDAGVVHGNVATMTINRLGIVPNHLSGHRILVLRSRSHSHSTKSDKFPGIHKKVREKVYERAVKLIDEWSNTTKSDGDESKLHFLKEAAKLILEPDNAPGGPHYDYGHRHYRIPHAILLYLLRPNKNARVILDEQIREIFKRPVAPETTIGLPIRGSDKCGSESTCLPFAQYMRLAKETWEGSSLWPSGNKRGAVIMTTEDENLFRQRLLYNETSGFPLEFIVNVNDSFQGSGNVEMFGQNADEIMLSSLIAIRMQLNAGHIYGNCCSNFHMMLFDFVREGCGLTTLATCLQETEDYKVCCSWDKKDEECQKKLRREYKNRRTHARHRDDAKR